MFRFIAPLILLGAASFVAYSNHDGDGEFLLLPFVEVLPWVGDGLQARGDATWQLLGGMGLVYLGFAGWGAMRRRERRRDDDEQMAEAEKFREWREATPWLGVDGKHEDDDKS
jgi:hypothetical protein